MKAIVTLGLAIAFALSPAFNEPFMGFRPDQLPIAQVNPPVQPEGYAFAIWGVIYIYLVVSALFGVLKRRDDAGWDRVRPALILSLAVGATWIPVALSNALAATVLIWVMLITALIALFRCPPQDRWWLQMPIALYAGWLTAASWVTVATIGAGYGLLFGQLPWALIGIFGALVMGVSILRARPQAPEYALNLIWALVGIIVANQMDAFFVSMLAAVGIVILILKAREAQQAA